jgi:hypothetical protein
VETHREGRRVNMHAYSKGAIGSLQLLLGSLGASVGGPGLHHAMQKLTRAFCFVAYDTLFRTREGTLPAVFGCLQ